MINKYYYCVNTFKNCNPIQLSDYVEANNEEEAIDKIVQLCEMGYEILELRKEEVKLNDINQ